METVIIYRGTKYVATAVSGICTVHLETSKGSFWVPSYAVTVLYPEEFANLPIRK